MHKSAARPLLIRPLAPLIRARCTRAPDWTLYVTAADPYVETAAQLTVRHPGEVAVLVSDLVIEVRATYPEVEVHGSRPVDADALGSSPAGPGSARLE
jgi:hypothetical protein